MMIKTHTFRGKRYKIIRAALRQEDGICCEPSAKQKFITIDRRLSGKRLLEVQIHEAMHACSWDMDEVAVEQTARDIASWLWRDGWRPTGEQHHGKAGKS